MRIIAAIFFSTVVFLSPKLLKWLMKYYKRFKTINKIKGVKVYPFIGNTAFSNNKDTLNLMIRNSIRFKNEPFFRDWIGTEPIVFFHRADYLDVLVSSSKFTQKSFKYNFLQPWLKTGLVTSSDDKWMQRRRMITPTFHFDILKSYLPIINEHTDILIQLLENKVNLEEEIDAFEIMNLTTLDIICETAMGISINAQTNKDSEYVRAVADISVHIMDRAYFPPYWIEFIFNLSSTGKKHNKCLEILHNFTRKVIMERNADFEKNNFNSTNRIAFLDMLLKFKHHDPTIKFDDIQEEVDTFMFAGHDTTATAISWTLQMIGSHPQVQAGLHDEIDSVFGQSDRHVSNEDLSNLKYLECVIKESMRILTPVPIYDRIISEDIEIGGYKIPSGTTATILAYMVHRDEKYYPNPEKFDPDRFLPENSIDRHPYAYIPFSAGKRNCIGQRFALMEEKVILANILRRFEIKSLKTLDEIEQSVDLLLRPNNKISLSLKIRQRN